MKTIQEWYYRWIGEAFDTDGNVNEGFIITWNGYIVHLIVINAQSSTLTLQTDEYTEVSLNLEHEFRVYEEVK